MTPQIDPRELLRRSFAQSAAVIAAVDDDQMELPTPCAAFDVRTLIGHMLFAANRIGQAGQRKSVPEDGPAVTGLADTEWTPAFDKAAAEACAVWDRPEALDGEITLPFGTFPATVVALIYVSEQVTHAWDLAVATDSPVELDPELAEAVLPMMTQMVRPEIQGAGAGDDMPFGPFVEVPADAPAYHRLAGFLGRQPTFGK